MTTRLKVHDWPWRLAEWSMTRIGKPFAWGETDCALLCLEAFDAMTDAHHAEGYRHRYATLRDALRFQREEMDLPRWLSGMGCSVVERAELGDFILVEKEGFSCGHVSFGDMCLSAWPGSVVAACEADTVLALPDARVLRVP